MCAFSPLYISEKILKICRHFGYGSGFKIQIWIWVTLWRKRTSLLLQTCICIFVRVHFFLKLQLIVIDFSFCIHLLQDPFSLRKSKLFALEMIGGSEMPGPIISSVNQSTSMVNDYLKRFERPALLARLYVTLLALKATSKFPYVTSPKIIIF